MRGCASNSPKPKRSMFARVRGCSANTSGSRADTSPQQREQRLQRLAVVDVRRPVQRHDAVARRVAEQRRVACPRAAASPAAGRPRRGWRAASRSSRCRRSTTRSAATPSRTQVVLPRCARSCTARSAIWSVSTRLISSGIAAVEAAQPGLDVRDRHALLHGDQRAGERRIDVADDEHAGRLRARRATGSKRRITSAVCTACVPEPTSRLMSGRGSRRSAKSRSLMSSS